MLQNASFALAVATGAIEREGIARMSRKPPLMQITQFERGVTQLRSPVGADPNQLMGATMHLHVGSSSTQSGIKNILISDSVIFFGVAILQPHQ